MVRCIGVTLRPRPYGIGTEAEALALDIDRDLAGMLELALAKHEMTEDEKAAGPSLDSHLPLHGRIVAGSNCAHDDPPIPQAVDPSAVAQADFEDRRHGQQSPSRPRIDEDPQAA